MESSGGKFLLGCNRMLPKNSLHAEMDVINKLINLNKIKKNKKINMLVIRVNNNGDLLDSYPCAQCITNLNNLCKQYNINLNWIYYSGKDGCIHQLKFTAIINSSYRHYRLKKD